MLLAGALLLAGCSDMLRLQQDSRGGGNAGIALQQVPDDVNEISLSVRASDMETQRETISVGSSSMSLEVPPGPDRTFRAQAGDYTARVTTDVPPSGTTVRLQLNVLSDLSVNSGNGEVAFTWSDPPDTDLDQVEISWDSEDGPQQPIRVSPGEETATVEALTNGTEYTFTVKAIYDGGNASAGVTLTYDVATWSAQSSPANDNLKDVWGTDSSNVWAVGNQGGFPPQDTILKWNGSSWSRSSPGSSMLFGVWGTDSSNVWAVADVEFLKWNGGNWSTQSTPTNANELRGVWGTDASNVWFVGLSGEILNWNGSSWSTQSAPTSVALYGVWGTDSSNVWAVGDSGTILKWDGSSWSTQSAPTSVALYGVWGTDSSNVWAVGDSGTILKWSGSSWSTQSSPTNDTLRGVWGTNASNVWAVGDNGTILKWSP
jgi:hypothetical protein